MSRAQTVFGTLGKFYAGLSAFIGMTEGSKHFHGLRRVNKRGRKSGMVSQYVSNNWPQDCFSALLYGAAIMILWPAEFTQYRAISHWNARGPEERYKEYKQYRPELLFMNDSY